VSLIIIREIDLIPGGLKIADYLAAAKKPCSNTL
jgi:hypothetical protein